MREYASVFIYCSNGCGVGDIIKVTNVLLLLWFPELVKIGYSRYVGPVHNGSSSGIITGLY